MGGLGLEADIPMVLFPIDLFLVESDITPVAGKIDEFEAGLTCWQPRATRTRAPERLPTIAVPGADYAEAFARFNDLALRRNWGDGLPLVPPTPERVRWILRGTDEPRETVVGKLMPRGGVVTIEVAAVALAMAGGRPEYLPVLLAALQAILDPALEHDGWQATSSSTFPVVIVNGPVATQIGLNSGFGLLGPDPRHPAGAAIGRALRLLQQNVGGALPGTGTMAMFGAMRYTNAVFAEDEAGLPEGWAPFNAERMGCEPGTNSVAVNVASGAVNIIRRGVGGETLQDEARQSLLRIATYMKSHNANCLHAHREGTPGILLMSRTVARQLAAAGWTKRSIQSFLWEHSRIPRSELEATGMTAWMERYDALAPGESLWPITSRPENIAIVVAGGSHPTHAFWMQTSIARTMTGAPVKLPAAWDALIAERREALGGEEDAGG